MGLAIECKEIKKQYGQGHAATMALRGASLSVQYGELLMLVGPSGSGKTTLISIITTILGYDSGECHVLGKDLAMMSDRQKTRLRRSKIGFLFQAFNLIPALSARENVAIPLLLHGQSMKKALQAADVLLEKVGLHKRKNAPPIELSGGEQQRVAICRALIHEPDLIVCDEPTSALDHETGQRTMELMREIVRTENRALIVVTHDQRIFPFADHLAKIDDGVIVQEESCP